MTEKNSTDSDRGRSTSGELPLVDIDVTENEITARDVADYRFEVEAHGWVETDADTPDVSLRVDETITGKATELRFDPGTFSFTILDNTDPEAVLTQCSDDEIREIGNQFHLREGTPIDLPEGSYRIRAESALTGFVWFDGAPQVSWVPETDHVALTFQHPTSVTVGFRSGVELPRGTVTVPPTPEGVATALSCLSAGLRTADPQRSFPSMRSHPPAIELGETTHVPEDVRDRAHDTGIEIVLPPTFDALLPAAPLAYYLGATVRTADEPPKLCVPDRNYELPLPEPPALQYRVANLLNRVFSLDCLVRDAGPWPSNVQEHDLIESSDIELDIESCYAESPAERLITYLDLDFASLADSFPDWPHCMYVDPDDLEEVLPAVPSLLADMSLIFTPDAREESDRIDEVANPASWKTVVGAIGTNAEAGEHGYHTSLAAYRNRQENVGRSDDRTSVTVATIGTERELAGEWLEAHYRQRLGTNGTVERRVIRNRAQLAEVFATPTDLLHLVGECGAEGIVCPDGPLVPADMPSNEVRSFVLDQPGAGGGERVAEIGRQLIDAGAICGVTVTDGTAPESPPPASLVAGDDAHALTSSPPFLLGGLLLAGASPEMARQTIRYLSGSGSMTVVGDGAYRTHSRELPTFLLEVNPLRTGEFGINVHHLLVTPGSVVATLDDRPMLSGAQDHSLVDARWVGSELLGEDIVLFGDDLYWPEESTRLFYPLA